MTWIFGYGSLVSPSSLASTIGRTVSVGNGMHIAELAGYQRAWNYGSEVLRGDWIGDDGTETIGGLVVSLGIVAAPGDSINGVVFAVDDDELADLDWRERAYDRIDVTDRITLIDQSASVQLDDPVAVYLPRPVSIARYERIATPARPASVAPTGTSSTPRSPSSAPTTPSGTAAPRHRMSRWSTSRSIRCRRVARDLAEFGPGRIDLRPERSEITAVVDDVRRHLESLLAA